MTFTNGTPMGIFRNASEALPVMMDALLTHGSDAPSRNGGSKELLGARIILTNPLEREIITPHRRASYPAQIAETMWVLAGRNDISWLSRYLHRAADFSDNGETWSGAYGPRLRRWSTGEARHGEDSSTTETADQLAAVVSLLKHDPGTRRAVMSIFDPASDIIDNPSMKDIPCNNWLHFIYREEQLHLFVVARSNDAFWGWSGINTFEWSVLLEIVAHLTGLPVGRIVYTVSSFHLYERHYPRARKIVEERDEPFTPSDAARIWGSRPNFSLDPQERSVDHLDELIGMWFSAEEKIYSAAMNRSPVEARGALEAVSAFPEPMMRGWLLVLADWWGLRPMDRYTWDGTAALDALDASPNRPQTATRSLALDEPVSPEAVLSGERIEEFTRVVGDLHKEKDEAYGDSWKRRGEMLGIMANIARKIDRLGIPGGGDTSADTAIDLLVYLVKYRWWLSREYEEARNLSWNFGRPLSGPPKDEDGRVRAALFFLAAAFDTSEFNAGECISTLRKEFDSLEQIVTDRDHREKAPLVIDMVNQAFALAAVTWDWEQEDDEIDEGLQRAAAWMSPEERTSRGVLVGEDGALRGRATRNPAPSFTNEEKEVLSGD